PVPSQDAELKRAGETLLKKWETENVLITLGEHGMMLFQGKETPHYIPTKAREVFDVSGAGDTAIALFTLGLACGATPTEAAEIANHASGVGRGFFTVGQYRAVESEVSRQLGHGLIDATYFCPDVPGQHSNDRKPAPGMIFQAKREHQIDLARSFFVGDKEIDVQCGRNAGLRTIRVQTGFDCDVTGSAADWAAKDLPAAGQLILEQ